MRPGAPTSDGITLNNINILEVVGLGERLHRQFLEALQLELDTLHIRDINSVRALMLLNMGDVKMSAGELLWRGCYLGSNVSYNLKKLTEAGYVIQERSSQDKRVIIVHISPKGSALCDVLRQMNARHIQALAKGNFKVTDLITCREALRTLQRIWAGPGEVDATGGVTHLAPGSARAAR